MAFLDNSGDIILDAVLTDAGRQRLAKGDGSFRITKFALGDDEINYNLYNKDHPSGSAYFDLDIMQTPVFEAFTNNIASLNSRLTSFSRTNLLYLPILKVNNRVTDYAISEIVQNGFILAADSDSFSLLNNQYIEYNNSKLGTKGILNGYVPTSGIFLRVDQGVDNNNYPASLGLDPDLVETQFLIEIDNKFGSITDDTGTSLKLSYVDDDDVAAYYVSLDDNTNIVKTNTVTEDVARSTEVLAGARGTTIKFRLKSSVDVSTSTYLFDQLGTDIKNGFTINEAPITYDYVKCILTSIRITGLTTGYSIDIPLALIKAY